LEIRNASEDPWKTSFDSFKDLPMLARLHRALSRNSRIKLGYLVAPWGRPTQSKGGTLELLLVAHFPKSVVSDEVVALPLPAVPNVWRGGWLGGLSLIGEWNAQLILLPHTKVQEWVGYS
jgi:hypothetical protein